MPFMCVRIKKYYAYLSKLQYALKRYENSHRNLMIHVLNTSPEPSPACTYVSTVRDLLSLK